MTTYIAFLRAINVGGHVVKMERLRELFTELGFSNVRTFIQSGNVFFETAETDRIKLAKLIEDRLQAVLGYEVATMLCTIPELIAILEKAPFKTMEPTPDTRHYIIFTARPILTDEKFPFVSPKNDFEILGTTPQAAFVLMRLINDRPGNPAAYIEKTYGMKATGRFYHTTLKILEAAQISK